MTARAKVLLALVPFVAWTTFRLASGAVRWEVIGFLIVPPVLALGASRLFVGLYPMGLTGVLYDAMGYARNVGVSPERVHLCDLRALEARLFGGTRGGEPFTVHDWFQTHQTPALDVVFAIPYAIFVFVTIGFAVWLWFRDYDALRRFAWCFCVVNLAGFATYHLYPAAPPWYFHAHGCVVDVNAPASEGAALARVDAWMGVRYFHGMYGRASDTFGAVPSLHVAYPLLIVLECWAFLRAPGRAGTILFFVAMCVAAVYLDHHWIIDVVLGVAYALVTFAAVRFVFAALAGRPIRAEVAAPARSPS